MKNYNDLLKALPRFQKISTTLNTSVIEELGENAEKMIVIKFVPTILKSGELNYRVSVNFVYTEKKSSNEDAYNGLRRVIDELDFLLDSDFNVKFSCFFNYNSNYSKIQNKWNFRSKSDKRKDLEIFDFFNKAIEKIDFKNKLESKLPNKEEVTRKHKI